MKRKLLLFSLVLMMSFGIKAQRFAVQPGIIQFNAEPGITQTRTLKITNISDKKITFQAYFADWLRDSLGGHEYYRADTLSRSCANWVVLNKNLIEVEPQATEDVVVVLKTPFDAKQFDQMKWAMLFLQTVQEKDSVAGNSKELKTEIRELMRVGIHIYQTPPTVNKVEAKVDYFMHEEKDSIKNSYSFKVENVGDVMLNCKSYITLTNITTGQEFKLERLEFPMFPEGKRLLKFVIPDNIPKGKYSALAVLDIGEDEELQAIEKTIDVT